MNFNKIKIYVLSLLGVGFLLTACGPREIPDRKMEKIIRDVFLVNSYYNQHFPRSRATDSMDIYTPILEDYGYELEDFRYTLDRWALKKSSRLSELIDNATAEIQRENDYYIARELMWNQADTVINNTYRDTVYQRLDSVRVRSLNQRDTLKVTIPLSPGSYRIRYRYLWGLADMNNYLVMRYNQKDSLDQPKGSNSRQLQRGGVKWMDVAFEADSTADRLDLFLADYTDNAKDVDIRIDSLYITYNEPLVSGRRRFLQYMIKISFGIDYPYEFDFPPKDSGALHVVPPLRPDTTRYTDF